MLSSWSNLLHCALRFPPLAAAVLIGGSAALAPAAARADDPAVTVRELDPKTGAALVPISKSLTYLSLGPTGSLIDAGNEKATYGLGLEASLTHYGVERVFAFGYGAFVQAQLIGGKYFRGDVGGQVNAGPGGLEIGLGLRQGDDTYATTASFHGALFISAGYLVLSYRISPELFAISSTGQAGFGFEGAFTISLKLPIAVQGRDPTGLAIQATGNAW